MTTDLTRAREALENYGKHGKWCDITRALPFEQRAGNLTCNCGFTKALAELSQAEQTDALRSGQGEAVAWRPIEDAPYGQYVLGYAFDAPWHDGDADPKYVIVKRRTGNGYGDRDDDSWDVFGPGSHRWSSISGWLPLPTPPGVPIATPQQYEGVEARAIIQEMYDAMTRYEVDVDAEAAAPARHRDMMARASKYLENTLNPAQPAPSSDAVVEITGMDEYGPMLGWHKHWSSFPIGTKFYAAVSNAAQAASDGVEP